MAGRGICETLAKSNEKSDDEGLTNFCKRQLNIFMVTKLGGPKKWDKKPQPPVYFSKAFFFVRK